MATLDLAAAERIVLSVDTSSWSEATELVKLAKQAGGSYVKFGLELASAESWVRCSELARQENINWIADAKLDDIPNTVQATVRNLKSLAKPPIGITMHVTAGRQAMAKAQAEAGRIIIFGVTVLTSLNEAESKNIYHISLKQKVNELAADAEAAGLLGLVCSAQEVSQVKKSTSLITLVPGVRSKGAARADQARVATPAEAIKSGADLLVIGRQITQAAKPLEQFIQIANEIEDALNK